MSKIFPRKTYYELKEKLGEGLTSEVYRAFRVDQTAWTKQVVALKIIKSKKNVQILKREFEKLSRVQSKYCVQMKSWENLPQGSALVLEYIEGLTLDEMDKEALLTPELINEVTVQIFQGLLALHRVHIYHGDLNLKNVIINTDGVIKLIDFGFFSSEKENWVTPFFADPSILNGKRPTAESDFYSLEKIKVFLMRRYIDEADDYQKRVDDSLVAVGEESFFHDIKTKNSRASQRRTLSMKVKKLRLKRQKGTQIIKNDVPRKEKIKLPYLLALLFFALFLLFPMEYFNPPRFATVELRSKQWVSVSINGLPPLFSPINARKLRSGTYVINWQTAGGSKFERVSLLTNKTFMLNPKDKNL